jgi:23S rRNA (cytosine1962-C5)-methyltransferase
MSFPRVILRGGEETRIEAGHPWIYDNEIAEVQGSPAPAQVVDAESARGRYLGRGFFNPASKIRVRLATRSKEGLDRGFWKRRVSEALDYRGAFLDVERDSFRLLFAEADGTPGLVADLFASAEGQERVIVLQFASAGVEARREDILGALRERLPGTLLMERSDNRARAHEGLPPAERWADPGCPESMTISERGLLMRVPLASGQKTGHYLDQRDNRLAVAAYARGRTVLDAFCNTGGFGLQALRAGAASVEFVDSSAEALRAARLNLELNRLDERRAFFMEANAFDFLREAQRSKRRYGMVVLDPPPFARDKESESAAWRGHKEINLRALAILEEGGWIVTCSCSQRFGQDKLLSCLREAARDAGRSLRLAELRHQSPDHPILSGYPESLYLSCIIARAD